MNEREALTDEQIDAVTDRRENLRLSLNAGRGRLRDFARAIEAEVLAALASAPAASQEAAHAALYRWLRDTTHPENLRKLFSGCALECAQDTAPARAADDDHALTIAYMSGFNDAKAQFKAAQPAAGAVPNLRIRLSEAHDASLDDDHRACRSILMECIRLLDATPPTAQPAEQQGEDKQ